MDWKDEMVKMLAAFERQAIHSLSKIKLALDHNGLSFNPNFKQYFLQASNARYVNCVHLLLNSHIS